MPDTFTPTLNLTKVGINESDDTWGTKLNDNCDKIDAASAADRTKIAALEARCVALEAEAAKASWVGEIRMHSGTLASVASIPGGVWKLCDGQNGTPNLVDKFILGAGGTIAVGATGGAKQWAGKVAAKTLTGLKAAARALTLAQMPRHKHGTQVTDPGHQHPKRSGDVSFLRGSLIVSAPNQNGSANLLDDGGNPGEIAKTGITVATIEEGGGQGHDHDLPNLSHDHEATVPTLPPFYALAFVKRVA
jgi:hypothetical protein